MVPQPWLSLKTRGHKGIGAIWWIGYRDLGVPIGLAIGDSIAIWVASEELSGVASYSRCYAVMLSVWLLCLMGSQAASNTTILTRPTRSALLIIVILIPVLSVAVLVKRTKIRILVVVVVMVMVVMVVVAAVAGADVDYHAWQHCCCQSS